MPLPYQFCEFFGLQYAFGIAADALFQRRAEPLQKRLARRYRRTGIPQRSFSSFRHRAGSRSRQRRICYKAEHTVTGTNLRFLITNCPGRAAEVFECPEFHAVLDRRIFRQDANREVLSDVLDPGALANRPQPERNGFVKAFSGNFGTVLDSFGIADANAAGADGHRAEGSIFALCSGGLPRR